MIPKKIGRYEIKAELGRGGMATVYLANDPRFEREVAIKVLPREMLHDPQFRTRFEREAKTIAMLEHPVIVPVYDFGEEDGQPYFVMRYMPGGSLSDRLTKNGPLTLQEGAHLIERLAPALDTAHAKGIIHRDLKPGNILFDQYGDPYISDFGIAKLAESQANVTGSAIVGTPAYMSPEQAQGDKVDGRSDIYGVGVILYEALTGRQPYSGDTPMSVVIKHITDPVPHILDVKPDLPAGIEKIIGKALAKDKNERFATCQSLADALGSVSRGELLDLGPAPTATRMSQPKTLAGRKTVTAPQTMLAKPGQGVAVAQPRKLSGLWIGAGIGAIVLCVFAVAIGLFIFRDQIPLFTRPTSTPPLLLPSSTQGGSAPTFTLEGGGLPLLLLETSTPTPALAATLTATLQVPVIGGADMIALINRNDIWAVRPDGTDLRRLTTDGAEKHSLQWSPDGQKVFYITGKCIGAVDLQDQVSQNLACFNSVELFEDLSISPDGSQIALAIDKVIYVVPFDLQALGPAQNHNDLLHMNGCFTYDDAASSGVRWSGDSRKIAVKIKGVGADSMWEYLIRVIDISSCNSANPYILDTFPASRFTMSNYSANRLIPFYDWSGEELFLLNSKVRNDVYGSLYMYDMSTLRAKQLSPISGCCYTDAVWSPDGSHLLFAFQDQALGAQSVNLLYYISYGTIGSGATYTPIPLPEDLLSNPLDHPSAVLRRGP